jgi:predicted RND superfamily exporter protein
LPGLHRFSIRYPKLVVALALVATAGVAPGLLRLEIRTDGHALVPHDAPEIRYDQDIRDEFGVEDPIVVLIRPQHPNGIFNIGTLELVVDLTEAFLDIERIHPWTVFSLSTERGDRVRKGTLIFRTFLEIMPKTQQDLDQLRDDLRAIELYTGTLVSSDESATSIMVGVPPGMERTELYRTVWDIIDDHAIADHEIHVIGAPVAEALLGTHILEDLGVPSAVLGHRTDRSVDRSAFAWPRSMYELRLMVARHIGLVPIALIVMAMVFMICFRSLIGTLLPLMEVGACLVFVFGLMGWCDVPVYLTIAVLPVILTAIGVADEIHIVARYRELLRDRPANDRVSVVTETMEEMWVPVTKTSVTTAVGFMSFALSGIAPVQAFGVFTAVGILFCMLWSLTVIPAMLCLFKLRRPAPRTISDGAAGSRRLPFFARLGGFCVRHRFVVTVLALAIVVAAPYGVRRVVVQDSWIDGFAPESEFRRATDYFNEQFLGTHILLVCVDAGSGRSLSGELEGRRVDHRWVHVPSKIVDAPEALVNQHLLLERPEPPGGFENIPPRQRFRTTFAARIESAVAAGDHIVVTPERRRGSPKLALRLKPDTPLTFEITPQPLKWPASLGRIEALEGFIEDCEAEAVGGVIGAASYLKTTSFMARARKEAERRIPDNPASIEWLWAQYGRTRGEKRLRQVLDADYTRALVTVFLEDANFVATARLLDKIRDYEQEHLADQGMSLSFAGDVAVSQTLINAIVSTQVRSLIGSLIGILAVTTLLGRSLRWGILSVFPCALAVLVNFAVMGMAGIPLGVATSMFTGMTLGIGVDFAIHLLERFRRAQAHGLDLESAIADAVGATGPAIVIDAVAVALGFGTLILSQVPANARLGSLVVLSIGNCLVATLVLLPALLRLVHRREHSADK